MKLQEYLDKELAGVEFGTEEYMTALREKTKEFYALGKPKPKTLDEQDAEYHDRGISMVGSSFVDSILRMMKYIPAPRKMSLDDMVYMDPLLDDIRARYSDGPSPSFPPLFEYDLKDTELSIHRFKEDRRWYPMEEAPRKRIDLGDDAPHPENSSGRGQGRNPMARNSIRRTGRR